MVVVLKATGHRDRWGGLAIAHNGVGIVAKGDVFSFAVAGRPFAKNLRWNADVINHLAECVDIVHRRCRIAVPGVDDREKFVDTEFLDIGHDQRMLEDN